jgi:hypothetical protein
MTPGNDLVSDSVEVLPPTGVEEGSSLPHKFAMDVVRPNPSRARTAVRYAIPVPTRVDLRVYSAGGRLVRTLVAAVMSPGYHSTEWDGRDMQGRAVQRGVYYIRLVTPKFLATRKLTRIE